MVVALVASSNQCNPPTAQQQQVMGLAQEQQGLGTAPQSPTVGQPGLGAGQQPRQPGGQNGLGGPYASHMQVCPT